MRVKKKDLLKCRDEALNVLGWVQEEMADLERQVSALGTSYDIGLVVRHFRFIADNLVKRREQLELLRSSVNNGEKGEPQ